MEERNHLTRAVDILFTLALFYALLQWNTIFTWQARILWVSLLLIIINEQVSVRASYSVYSLGVYFLDLLSILLYFFALAELAEANSPIGYGAEFWAAIAILWLAYAMWDLIMMRFARDSKAKASLRKWAVYMILASLITVGSYLVMRLTYDSLDNSIMLILNSSAQIASLLIILWALYLWNKNRLERISDVLSKTIQDKDDLYE